MQYFKIRFTAPFFKRGNIYGFDDETGEVYRVEDNIAKFPLRHGLSNYLWLCRTEPHLVEKMFITPIEGKE